MRHGCHYRVGVLPQYVEQSRGYQTVPADDQKIRKAMRPDTPLSTMPLKKVGRK